MGEYKTQRVKKIRKKHTSVGQCKTQRVKKKRKKHTSVGQYTTCGGRTCYSSSRRSLQKQQRKWNRLAFSRFSFGPVVALVIFNMWCVCVCVCACVCACMRVFVHVCVCVWVGVGVCAAGGTWHCVCSHVTRPEGSACGSVTKHWVSCCWSLLFLGISSSPSS